MHEVYLCYVVVVVVAAAPIAYLNQLVQCFVDNQICFVGTEPNDISIYYTFC